MKVLLASNNKKKLIELKMILSDSYDIITLHEAGIESIPEETGKTFAENAYIKALAGMKASGLPCIADDSGLEVEALNGEPGIYSARYSSINATDSENNTLLLTNMKDIKNRNAAFICAICFVFPDESQITAFGCCEGIILNSPRGENGFGYDPLFYVDEYKKTFAELSLEIKNKISHRARALQELKNKLEDIK